MASVTSRHIDHVISVGLGGTRADAPGALFSKSWARCMKQHGLDPTRPAPARILPSHQVRERRQRMEGLLRVARAGMGAPPEPTRLLTALKAMKAHHWNVSATAQSLCICRATVYRQMKRQGITPPHLQ